MERVKWIDIIKGIGIFLVVWGHSNLVLTGINDYSYITKYIYSFHIPLFFYISGYLCYSSSNKNFKDVLIKKIHTLIIPYVFFSVLAILIDIIRLKNHIVLSEELTGFFYLEGRVVWNEPIWFLISLFFVEIIFYWITQIKSKEYYFLILLLSSLVGFGLGYKNIILPFGFSIVFTGLVFYAIGNFISRNKANRLNLAMIIPCLLISIIIPIYFNTIISMYFIKYGNMIYFYIGALSSIFLYIQLSKKIENIKFLSRIFRYLGGNSLIILCTHFTLLYVFSACIKRIPALGLLMINSDIVKGLIYTIVVLVISIPIIYVMNNCLPYIIGGKSKKTNNNGKITAIQ